MEIWRFKKDFSYCIGGCYFTKRKGERVFKEDGSELFESRSYPLQEFSDFKFVDEYLEFVENSPHNKEYYLNPVWTQEQIDEELRKYNNPITEPPSTNSKNNS